MVLAAGNIWIKAEIKQPREVFESSVRGSEINLAGCVLRPHIRARIHQQSQEFDRHLLLRGEPGPVPVVILIKSMAAGVE